MQTVVAVRLDQRRDRAVARAQGFPLAQRPPHPATQLPRAHRRRRAVDDADERRVLAPRETGVELEVAPRGGIHHECLVARLAHERSQVGQGAFLRVPRVLQQRARRADRERQVLAAESREVLRAELRRERAARGVGQEMPGRALDDARLRGERDAFRQQQLRGPQPLEFRRQRFAALALEHAEPAGAEVEPGEAEAIAVDGERGEQVFAPGIEQRVVGDGPRRQDAHDLARDRAF